LVKINEGVDVVNLVAGSAEFERQRAGDGSRGLRGQKRIHLPLDRKLLSLQLPHSQRSFLEDKVTTRRTRLVLVPDIPNHVDLKKEKICVVSDIVNIL